MIIGLLLEENFINKMSKYIYFLLIQSSASYCIFSPSLNFRTKTHTIVSISVQHTISLYRTRGTFAYFSCHRS